MDSPLQLVAPLFIVFAAIIVGTERRLVRELRIRGALSPQTATPLETTMAVQRWRLSRLMSQGVIRETSPSMRYLDEDGYRAYRRRRRIRAAVAAATVIVLFIFLAAVGVIRM
jgi:hypothetical protein